MLNGAPSPCTSESSNVLSAEDESERGEKYIFATECAGQWPIPASNPTAAAAALL